MVWYIFLDKLKIPFARVYKKKSSSSKTFRFQFRFCAENLNMNVFFLVLSGGRPKCLILGIFFPYKAGTPVIITSYSLCLLLSLFGIQRLLFLVMFQLLLLIIPAFFPPLKKEINSHVPRLFHVVWKFSVGVLSLGVRMCVKYLIFFC